MKIKSLIEEAQVIKDSIVFPEGNVEYLMSLPGCTLPDRQKYETWKNKCLIYLGNSGLDHDIITRFKDSMKKFENLGFTPNYMDEMIGVLKAVEENEKAKKTKKKDTEVIAKCENQQLAVTNCDLKNINIESLIRTIRGQKVMVDFDLAMLYGVLNKRLNEQVKRNIERFPDDFMFQLTKEEWNTLRSQIATANTPEDKAIAFLRSQFATTKNLSKIRTLPYAFTRNGIGMLSSVLGSETAVAMNIRIMRAFTASQQIMESNAILFKRVFHLEQHQQETDEKISILMTKMDDISPKLLPEQIFATGCVWDAWTYVSDLVRSAKQRIVLIDNFVDDRVLSLLDKRADNVETTIHSRYYEPFQTDLKKHNEQYREIKFVQLSQKNHDRFLIIDDDVYLLGASVKDMGVGLCAVAKMEASPETILGLICNLD